MNNNSFNNPSNIAIIAHTFYKDGWDIIEPYIKNLINYSPKLLINIPADKAKGNGQKIKDVFKDAVIISSPNIGKDIGGKLALLETYMKTPQKSDYILLIHDKKSPQVLNGKKWKNDLMSIATPENIAKALNIFEENSHVGIICSSACISNEYDAKKDEFNTTNNLILKDYLNRFEFELTDYSFVAGNMFWVRSVIYEAFFKKHRPLKLRSELEKGNVLDHEKGSNAHSLERLFSWIVTSQGYEIKGI